ncbi:SUMF1/EgtB/PvdO family nonheme iron enzyme [Streptomyces sp. KL116D]|uniref:SUMF1/EgtB/PvdO family nonheme iron enzyme n=1 Tax=Streptomyces sp. KL116D TaxID=3045152 RepID=UPI0035593447
MARENEWSVIPVKDTGSGRVARLRAALRRTRQRQPGGPRRAQPTAAALQWWPAECDVSIRPGWFYHADQQPKSVEQLTDVWFRSVGRGAVLLSSASRRTGTDCAPAADVATPQEFRERTDRELPRDLARGARVTDDGAGARTVDLGRPLAVDRIRLAEDIRLGRQVEQFVVEAEADGAWRTVAALGTIGAARILPLAAPVTARRWRLRVTRSRSAVHLKEFGLCTSRRCERTGGGQAPPVTMRGSADTREPESRTRRRPLTAHDVPVTADGTGSAAPACCAAPRGATAPGPDAATGRPASRALRPRHGDAARRHVPHGSEDERANPGDGEGPVRESRSPRSHRRTRRHQRPVRGLRQETGHVTAAERFGWSYVFAGFLTPSRSGRPGARRNPWWRGVEGATWRAPARGPASATPGQAPVVHVSWDDAQAYARWAASGRPPRPSGSTRPAAALDQARYPWGDETDPARPLALQHLAGGFPKVDTGADGHIGTAPVDAYRPNARGLHNVVGNVWEWVADRFTATHDAARAVDPRGPDEGGNRAMRGGSTALCHGSYCNRYRVAARTSSTPDSSSGSCEVPVRGRCLRRCGHARCGCASRDRPAVLRDALLPAVLVLVRHGVPLHDAQLAVHARYERLGDQVVRRPEPRPWTCGDVGARAAGRPKGGRGGSPPPCGRRHDPRHWFVDWTWCRRHPGPAGPRPADHDHLVRRRTAARRGPRPASPGGGPRRAARR